MTRHLSARMSAGTLTLAGLCLGATTLATATTAQADVLASYSLDYVDSTRTAAGTTPADVSAGRYYAHGGTQIYSSDNHGRRVDAGRWESLATIGDSVANDEYGEFAITADAGMQLDLSSLDIGMQITRGTDEEHFTVHLRSSIDDFASDIDTATLMGDSDIDIVDGSGTFDLSGAAHQNLTGTTSFRLYLVSNVAGSSPSSSYVRITPNVVLNGTVAPIPEPATLGLAALGGLVMLGRRR